MSLHQTFIDHLLQKNYLFEVIDETAELLIIKISIRVKPRSHKGLIYREEVQDKGGLVAQVRATPVEGEANAELCELLARSLGLAVSKVEILKGDHSKIKLLILKYEFSPQRSYEFYQQKIKAISLIVR